MRYSGSWQSVWDDRILEIIAEEGPSSPKTILDTGLVHVSKAHISRRLSKMADHGLLHRLPNGVYALTDAGEAYLEGEYDAEAEEFIDESNADEYSLGGPGTEANGA
jgi:DeoR/GlpR family transcriptional regulator of sugar metabolism